MSENKKKQERITFVCDEETVDRIKSLQKETGIFSRSAMIRNIIKAGYSSTKAN